MKKRELTQRNAEKKEKRASGKGKTKMAT